MSPRPSSAAKRGRAADRSGRDSSFHRLRALPEPTPSLNASTLVPVRSYPGISAGFGHQLATRPRRGARSARALAAPRPPYELELSPDLVSYQDAIATLISSSTVLPSALGAAVGLQGWADQLARGAHVRDPAYSSLFTPAERAAWASSRAG